jgi:hypothetical protein
MARSISAYAAIRSAMTFCFDHSPIAFSHGASGHASTSLGRQASTAPQSHGSGSMPVVWIAASAL